MNDQTHANNANDLYKQIIHFVNRNFDFESAPRGKKIREIVSMTSVLKNPLDCLITIKERKLNYQFAIIEKFEYLWGKHDPERLISYNSNLKSYAGQYKYFDGNYAQRFNFWIEHIYNILKSDNDSRQAVISIYDTTARHQSADIPCTLSLQFFIRENKLHLITTMRSNDLLWGFPYDVNAFCFIQEVMAYWLGISVGIYTHQVGSAHIYLEPAKNYEQLLSCVDSKETIKIENPKWNLSYEETKEWLPYFFHCESRIRRGVMKLSEVGIMPEVLKKYLEILSYKWLK